MHFTALHNTALHWISLLKRSLVQFTSVTCVWQRVTADVFQSQLKLNCILAALLEFCSLMLFVLPTKPPLHASVNFKLQSTCKCWGQPKPFIYEARDSNKHLFVCVYLDGWIYWGGPRIPKNPIFFLNRKNHPKRNNSKTSRDMPKLALRSSTRGL